MNLLSLGEEQAAAQIATPASAFSFMMDVPKTEAPKPVEEDLLGLGTTPQAETAPGVLECLFPHGRRDQS